MAHFWIFNEGGGKGQERKLRKKVGKGQARPKGHFLNKQRFSSIIFLVVEALILFKDFVTLFIVRQWLQSSARILTYFVRGSITGQLTYCFTYFISADLIMLNYQQIYMFGHTQTRQTGGQLYYSDTSTYKSQWVFLLFVEIGLSR